MFISNLNQIYGQDGSIRRVLVTISTNQKIENNFLESELPKITIYSTIDLKDIMGKIVYKEHETIPFKLLEDEKKLINKTEIPIEISFEHPSTIPTFDNKIGITAHTELNFRVEKSNKKSDKIQKEVSPEKLIMLDSNVESLRDKALSYYNIIKSSHQYLSSIGVEEDNNLINRIKKINGKDNS